MLLISGFCQEKFDHNTDQSECKDTETDDSFFVYLFVAEFIQL